MSKQVLSIEQMQNLQELGLELNPTMLCYKKNKLIDDATWSLDARIDRPSNVFDEIPAYTLQDVLGLLPKSIKNGSETWLLEIGVYLNETYWEASYVRSKTGTAMIRIIDEKIIGAAYELLCWAIKYKYVETNKATKT